MREIFPGVLHWTTHHEGIGFPVSSYFVVPAGVVIDPMTPGEGLDALAERGTPQQVVLTSGLHTRHADRFADAFGCPIVVSAAGAERIGGELEVETYAAGDEVAPGVTPIEVGVLCPDEYALHLDVDRGAIALADALHTYGESLGFFSDNLLGAEAPEVREGLHNRLHGLLERDFEHLLLAHGDPIVRGGKTAMRDFLASPAGHEDHGQSA